MAVNFSKYKKNQIISKLKEANFYPLDVMVTGVTGAGKSTTLNSLFHKDVSKVGDGVDPETMGVGAFLLNDIFRIWDTPGLGDGVNIDKIHKKKMIDLLNRKYYHYGDEYGFIDMVLVIIEGSNRDMGTTYTLLNDVIIPNIQSDRILVAINQADMSMKGRNWNDDTKTPNPKLLEFLEEQADSIQNRVKESTGISILKPVYYSAEYGYNVEAVMNMIIDNIPSEKRRLPNSVKR